MRLQMIVCGPIPQLAAWQQLPKSKLVCSCSMYVHVWCGVSGPKPRTTFTFYIYIQSICLPESLENGLQIGDGIRSRQGAQQSFASWLQLLGRMLPTPRVTLGQSCATPPGRAVIEVCLQATVRDADCRGTLHPSRTVPHCSLHCSVSVSLAVWGDGTAGLEMVGLLLYTNRGATAV